MAAGAALQVPDAAARQLRGPLAWAASWGQACCGAARAPACLQGLLGCALLGVPSWGGLLCCRLQAAWRCCDETRAWVCGAAAASPQPPSPPRAARAGSSRPHLAAAIPFLCAGGVRRPSEGLRGWFGVGDELTRRRNVWLGWRARRYCQLTGPSAGWPHRPGPLLPPLA